MYRPERKVSVIKSQIGQRPINSANSPKESRVATSSFINHEKNSSPADCLGPKISQYFVRSKREFVKTVIVITEFDYFDIKYGTGGPRYLRSFYPQIRVYTYWKNKQTFIIHMHIFAQPPIFGSFTQ